MKLTLEPTDKVRKLNGEDVREWRGVDEEGVEVIAYIAAVSAQTHDEAVQKRYSEALMDRGFARLPAIDLRYIL